MGKDILDSKRVVKTIELLCLRIEERFPGSGLAKTCRQLLTIGEETDNTILWIAKPNYWYRAGVGAFIAVVLLVLVFAVSSLEVDSGKFKLADFVQVMESALNDIILLGAAIVFLVSIETRAKRKKIITSINTLRSVAHIVDAHQLTKDPDRVSAEAKDTKHSPKPVLTRYELGRYLDYCSEMLSLTGKVSYLYVQDFNDPASVTAVNDLEGLTTGLSRKIWQKIMILNTHRAHPQGDF